MAHGKGRIDLGEHEVRALVLVLIPTVINFDLHPRLLSRIGLEFGIIRFHAISESRI